MRAPTSLIAWVLLAAAAFIVFRSGLGLYFAQDDFHDLALAMGRAVPPVSAWRSISRAVLAEIMHPMFGLDPRPYHAAILLLHIVNAGLVYMLARRWTAAPAALVAAAFFAVHPAMFTALHWISARADVLAATFGLLAVLALCRPDRGLWLAVPLFLASLLSKESLVLLPVVAVLVLLIPGRESADVAVLSRQRWIAVLVMAAGSIAFTTYLVAGGQSGVGYASEASSAYALSVGTSTWNNLLTYIGWTVDVVLAPRPLRFVDVVDPALFTPALVVVVASLVAASRRELRSRGWLVGAVGFLLLITPVLFFENHTYRYYLYGPLIAGSLCIGAIVDFTYSNLGRLRSVTLLRTEEGRTRGAWVLTVAAWLTLVLLAHNASTTNIERRSPVYQVLYGDPTVDRARIARRMIEGLRVVEMPRDSDLSLILRERVAALSRLSRGMEGPVPPDEFGYAERNVKAAVLDGVGVSVMIRRVRSAEFALQPPAFWGNRLVVLYSPVGEVAVFDSAGFAQAWESDWIVSW